MLVTSAATGEGIGVLAAVLSGTVVLLGPSGAGKSTPGNRLPRENANATSRTDARLRAEQERPMKDIARLRRAINRSSHRKA